MKKDQSRKSKLSRREVRLLERFASDTLAILHNESFEELRNHLPKRKLVNMRVALGAALDLLRSYMEETGHPVSIMLR